MQLILLDNKIHEIGVNRDIYLKVTKITFRPECISREQPDTSSMRSMLKALICSSK